MKAIKVLILTLLGLLAACAGALVPFRLELSPQNFSLAQGQNHTATLTLIREGALGDTINFTLLGAPAGVTGSFTPNPLGVGPVGANPTSSFSLSAGASVVPGTYTLTIRGSGTPQVGGDPRTAPTFLLPFTLTVTGETTGPDFSLPLTAAPTGLLRGRSLTIAIPIQRKNDFTVAVSLTLEGNLEGLTHSFNPQTATSTSSQLTLSAAPTAPVGSRTFTIKGTATIGAQTITRTATFTLNIVAGDG